MKKSFIHIGLWVFSSWALIKFSGQEHLTIKGFAFSLYIPCIWTYLLSKEDRKDRWISAQSYIIFLLIILASSLNYKFSKQNEFQYFCAGLSLFYLQKCGDYYLAKQAWLAKSLRALLFISFLTPVIFFIGHRLAFQIPV